MRLLIKLLFLFLAKIHFDIFLGSYFERKDSVARLQFLFCMIGCYILQYQKNAAHIFIYILRRGSLNGIIHF